MRIVDAQIHLWGSGLPSNMAHRQVTSFTTEEALGLMDDGGVDAAVIHPPGWDPNSTEMAFEAVRDFLYARMRGVKETHAQPPQHGSAEARTVTGDRELAATLQEVARELRELRLALAARPPTGKTPNDV